ncbi:hypothetical protein H0H92_000489 [Tricholoma furcatifolium]|nr:hypothetical protein H0H92_000489 [Tricholoma furcatifolium]
MQCLFLLFLWFASAAYAIVTLDVGSTVAVGVPTNVSWTRVEGDPTAFDLRFVTENGTDDGFAATINVQDDQLSGSTPVTFPMQGQFVLVGVDYNNNDEHVAESSLVSVSVSPTASSSSIAGVKVEHCSPDGYDWYCHPYDLIHESYNSFDNIIFHNSKLVLPITSSPTIKTSQQPSNASSNNSIRTTAIIGGVLGGLILIVVLMIIFILVSRRREKAKLSRRITFHQDLMVQRPPVLPDLEIGQGPGIGTNPTTIPPLGLQAPVSIPTPQRPTRPQFPASPLYSPVEHPPTHRQIELGSRIVQIEQQMMSIRRQNRGQAGIEPVLEQMKKQVDWLRAERDSPWARCETDERPPLLDYYME